MIHEEERMEEMAATVEDDNYFDSYEDIEVGLACSDSFAQFFPPVVALWSSIVKSVFIR